MTWPEIVTYIIAPTLTGLAAIWTVVKVIIPRMVEARLEDQRKRTDAEIEEKKDTREFTQAEKRLVLDYAKTEATEAQRMFGEIISDLQQAKERGDNFVRTTVFDGLDKIKTNADYIPVLRQEVKDFERRLTELETKHRLLIDLLTAGLVTLDQPLGNYDSWKKSKLEGQGHD